MDVPTTVVLFSYKRAIGFINGPYQCKLVTFICHKLRTKFAVKERIDFEFGPVISGVIKMSIII